MRVAWISEYPVEWMQEAPENIRKLPKHHPATWLRVLSEEFNTRDNIELHVIALRNTVESDSSFKLGKVHFHVVRVPKLARAASFFWTDTWVIRRALKRIQPDLLHAWGSERGASLVASRLNYPYLVSVQGLLTWYRELIPYGIYDHFSTEAEEIALRRARVITTECRFASHYLRARYPQAEVIQAEHAPNWHFHQVARQPRVEPPRLVFIGTPGHRKGTDLLLKALNEMVSEFAFELTIIGGGADFIRDMTPPLKPDFLGRIRVIPGLSPEGVAQELSAATILVLPTRADTSPNAVKEAVVAGVPVVASAIGGILDYVEPGLNGLRFEAGNLSALVASLRTALGHHKFSVGEVDPQCLRRMRSYLSPSQMADNFLTAYRRTLELYGKPDA